MERLCRAFKSLKVRTNIVVVYILKMSAGVATFNPSVVPQSLGQKKISRLPVNTTVNRYSAMREGTGYAWSEADVFPFNETGKVYEEITKNINVAPLTPKGDYIPQNVFHSRTLYNPPARAMPFLHGASQKFNFIEY